MATSIGQLSDMTLCLPRCLHKRLWSIDLQVRVHSATPSASPTSLPLASQPHPHTQPISALHPPSVLHSSPRPPLSVGWLKPQLPA